MRKSYLTGLAVSLAAVSGCGTGGLLDQSRARLTEACTGVFDPRNLTTDQGIDNLVQVYIAFREEGYSRADALIIAGELCDAPDLYATTTECTTCNLAVIGHVYDN